MGFGGTGWQFKGFFFRDSSSCGFIETALPFDESSGGLSHRLGGRGEKGWALVGQDGGLKAFSFVILPHAVLSKPRYLEEAISFVILPHAVSSKPRYLEEEGGEIGDWRFRI